MINVRTGLIVAIGLATIGLVGCGGEDVSTGVQTADATAVMISTDTDVRVAEVSMTLSSTAKDELRGASVDPSFAGKVTLAAYAGTSGGDGHLGHLDPETGATHSHGGKLAIDIPADQDVRIGPGGTAQVRVRDLVSEPDPTDTFQLTLEFERAPSVVVKVTVADS